jgi:flavin-binding protein dodecin
MADIAKVITIIGSSPESFAKAADAAVQEARRRCAASAAPTSSR